MRAKLLFGLLAGLLGGSACVRWGVPDDEGLGDDESDSVTTVDPSAGDGDGDSGESGSTETGEPDFPWPEPWPLGPGARVVVWGKTGIPTRNLVMFENILRELGGVSGDGDGDGDPTTGDGDGDPTTGDGDGDLTTGDGDGDPTTGDGDGDLTTGDGDGDPEPAGPLAILWIDDCDPRTDPVGCLAGNVQPFFDMVATLGTIEFKPLSLVDPLAYDVVIADFCGPVGVEPVAEMLGDGAHVLVLGDTWCGTDLGVSADLANELLEHLGTRFTGEVLYNDAFLVADPKQVGLLAEVPVLDAWGVALQQHDDRFSAAAETVDGALLTQRSE